MEERIKERFSPAILQETLRRYDVSPDHAQLLDGFESFTFDNVRADCVLTNSSAQLLGISCLLPGSVVASTSRRLAGQRAPPREKADANQTPALVAPPPNSTSARGLA